MGDEVSVLKQIKKILKSLGNEGEKTPSTISLSALYEKFGATQESYFTSSMGVLLSLGLISMMKKDGDDQVAWNHDAETQLSELDETTSTLINTRKQINEMREEEVMILNELLDNKIVMAASSSSNSSSEEEDDDKGSGVGLRKAFVFKKRKIIAENSVEEKQKTQQMVDNVRRAQKLLFKAGTGIQKT